VADWHTKNHFRRGGGGLNLEYVEQNDSYTVGSRKGMLMYSGELSRLELRRLNDGVRTFMFVAVKQEVMFGYILKEGSGLTVDKDLGATGDSRDHYFIFCRRYNEHVKCLFSGSVDYGKVLIDWQSTSGV
jgi:hypothetical protein